MCGMEKIATDTYSFEDLRQGGSVYVDKTAILKTLAAAEARLLVGRLVAGDVLALALDGGAAETPFLWLVRGGCLIIR